MDTTGRTALAYRTQTEEANALFRRSLSREEIDARMDGLFFSPLETFVVMDRDFSIEASNFLVIRRDQERGKQIYPNTVDSELLETCDEASSLKSDSTNTNQRTSTVDFLLNQEGERAHLFSNAPICHAAYFQLVQAASGMFEDDYFKRRKLLNGMKGRTRRMDDSGLKHSKYNKFHLFLQKQLLDSTPPALIIIPILSVQEIQLWDGLTSYEAMAIPCGPRSRYAARMTLLHVRNICSQAQVEKGIALLNAFVKDIAESLLDKDNDVLEDFGAAVGETKDASAVRWIRLVGYLRALDAPFFPLPVLQDSIDWEAIRVAKGTFDRSTSCLPDPFLLAAKAAINFSSIVGKKLMPAPAIDL